MPFGQSYGIYRIVSNVVEDACKTTGTPDAASKAAGNMVGMLAGVATSMVTLDPLGGAATVLHTKLKNTALIKADEVKNK